MKALLLMVLMIFTSVVYAVRGDGEIRYRVDDDEVRYHDDDDRGYRGEGRYRGDGYRGEGRRGDGYRYRGERGDGYRYRGEGYRYRDRDEASGFSYDDGNFKLRINVPREKEEPYYIIDKNGKRVLVYPKRR